MTGRFPKMLAGKYGGFAVGEGWWPILESLCANIQQVTKAGDFAGSNRLKHMTEAMCHIDRIKGSDERKVYFSKNRDCDTESYIKYRIGLNQIEYSLPTADDEE